MNGKGNAWSERGIAHWQHACVAEIPMSKVSKMRVVRQRDLAKSVMPNKSALSLEMASLAFIPSGSIEGFKVILSKRVSTKQMLRCPQRKNPEA